MAIFSKSNQNFETVKNYIQIKKSIIVKITFQEEYIQFLEEHEIEYDFEDMSGIEYRRR